MKLSYFRKQWSTGKKMVRFEWLGNICTCNLAEWCWQKFGEEFYVVIVDRKWPGRDGAKTRDQIGFFCKGSDRNHSRGIQCQRWGNKNQVQKRPETFLGELIWTIEKQESGFSNQIMRTCIRFLGVCKGILLVVETEIFLTRFFIWM